MADASPEQPRRWALRLARAEDIPALHELIASSVRSLLAPHYAPEVLEASIGSAFGVDSQLIRDGTYFVAEHEGRLVACGGWSFRATTYGGDRHTTQDAAQLDPATEAARIRAFFVHPDYARQGLGKAILAASEAAARAAGFSTVMLIGTLAGEKLYSAHGYRAEESYDAPLPGGLGMPVIRMTKSLT